MRVRTGWVRWSRGRGPGVQVKPLWPQGGDTVMPPPRLAEGTVDEAVTRQAPGSLAAPRGQFDGGTREPHGQQLAPARARPSPRVPGAQPEASSAPAVPFAHCGRALAGAEVVEPSEDVGLASVEARCQAAPVAPVGEVTDPRREPLNGGLCPVARATSPREAEASTRPQACGDPRAGVEAQPHAPLAASAAAAPDTPRRRLAAPKSRQSSAARAPRRPRRSNSTSSASRRTVARTGESGPPCGPPPGVARDCRPGG